MRERGEGERSQGSDSDGQASYAADAARARLEGVLVRATERYALLAGALEP